MRRLIINKFIKRHVCLQKAAEALVRYRSDGLVTVIKQECLKMSFKTMFRIAQHDVCRQTVPNDRCDVVERTSSSEIIPLSSPGGSTMQWASFAVHGTVVTKRNTAAAAGLWPVIAFQT